MLAVDRTTYCFLLQTLPTAEPILIQQVQDTIERLPLEVDTEAKRYGNCWVRAVEQQLQRKDLKGQLNTMTEEALKTQEPKDLNLKKKIAEFATTFKHHTVLKLREEFQSQGA